MKAIILISCLASVSSAQASSCPAGLSQIALCSPSAQPGDSREALGIFDAIVVCGDNSKAVLVLQKNARSEGSDVDQIQSRMDGIKYTILSRGENLDLLISTAPMGRVASARLTITNTAPLRVNSCTYSCQK